MRLIGSSGRCWGAGHGSAEAAGLDLPAMGCKARLTCSDYRGPTELASPYTSAKVVDGRMDRCQRGSPEWHRTQGGGWLAEVTCSGTDGDAGLRGQATLPGSCAAHQGHTVCRAWITRVAWHFGSVATPYWVNLQVGSSTGCTFPVCVDIRLTLQFFLS